MTIRVDVRDALEATGRLEQVLEHPKPFLEIIAEELYLIGRQSFEREQSPEGRPWFPLSLRYKQRKARMFPGRGILRFRGQLVRSLRRGIDEGSATAWATAGPLAHAAVHQHGVYGNVSVRAHRRRIKSRDIRQGRSKIASGVGFVKQHMRRMHIPARPYLGFPPEAQERAARDIEETAKEIFDGKAPNR